ncbi:MAG: glycosyltransferase family 4 protein [Gemmatimonadetes bacterium]|nr:glycosyltransferase family 4 protein [Gemmatimonadota bacterium]MBI2402288.1 glycosyltransferase family 4 protein [Gemmatimonadota bacterium]MBI2614267.1 glycosyltransferase family 4 protein [Gemmatimonadota bacterium]
MTSVLLVPDLPLERWPSMDRYASRLALYLKRYATDLEIAIAGEIGGLTVDQPSSDVGIFSSNPTPFPLLPTPGLNETRRYVSRYWTYPYRIRWMAADLMHVLDHSYAHIVLSWGKGPRIVTVHDLLPVLTVERGGNTMRERMRNRLLERVLKALRTADAWIVATEWLRGELGRWLGHDERIHVIPYGVDDAFFHPPEATRADTRRRLGIPEDGFVVLHVGTVGPRKNVPAVMAAVRGLRQAGMDAWLLQVGGAFSHEQEHDLVTQGIKEVTRNLAEAVEPELRAAYRAADVLLFPSHYEGFGFPVLEAMASGLPVVTSGAGGLAEVAGDAAVVVGGRETGPYVQALRRLAGNPQWCEQLVERGVERAHRFRWVETARKTAEVYRALMRT